MAKFLALDGTSGTYASTPHSDAVDITGDLTLVARIAPDTWQGGSAATVVSKTAGVDDRSWMLRLEGDGSPRLWIVDADGVSISFSTASGDGSQWIAVALELDNGAGASVASYFLSSDGVSWAQHGGAVTQPVIASINSTAHEVVVGAYATGFAPFTGTIYRAQIYSGAGFDLNSGPTGTLVADFNPGDAPDYAKGGDSFTSALTGETWTLHGNATIGDDHPLVISDDMVLEPKLPRPSVCLTAMARREVRLQAVWRQCR